jgi:hypothetical protein
MQLPAGDLVAVVVRFVGRLLQWLGSVILTPEAAALAAIVGASISLYRFGYRRPELLIDVGVRHSREVRQEGHTTAVMRLFVVNAGHSFAEDVQITLALDAFHFENDIETSEHPTDAYEVPSTTLDIASGRMSGYLGGGRRHDIYVARPIYEQDVLEMYFGNSIFENKGPHELKYTIACREHGLRKGTVEIEVEDGDLNLTRDYPTRWRNLKARLGWSPELTRPEEVENL